MQECSISARTGAHRGLQQYNLSVLHGIHIELKADTAVREGRLEEKAARFATKVIMIATCTRVAKMLDMKHLPTTKERHASFISWTDTCSQVTTSNLINQSGVHCTYIPVFKFNLNMQSSW